MHITAGHLIAACTYGGFSTSTPIVPTDSLLSTPADILYAYLVDDVGWLGSPALGENWPLFTGYLPDDHPTKVPTDAALVLDSPGFKNVKVMQGQQIEKYGVQMTFRSDAYTDGWEKADYISVALDSVNNVSVTNGVNIYQIQNVSRQGTPIYLGVDEKRASKFTVNLLITLKRII